MQAFANGLKRDPFSCRANAVVTGLDDLQLSQPDLASGPQRQQGQKKNTTDFAEKLELHRRLYFVFQGTGGLVKQGVFCFLGGLGTV